jgi:hypothetical protein
MASESGAGAGMCPPLSVASPKGDREKRENTMDSVFFRFCLAALSAEVACLGRVDYPMASKIHLYA